LSEKVQITFRPGRWFLGFALPWYAGANDARKEFLKLLPKGTTVNVNPKETALPAGVDPHADPKFHGQSWDTWAEASYSGHEMVFTLERAWAWLVYLPPVGVPSSAPRSAPSKEHTPVTDPMSGQDVSTDDDAPAAQHEPEHAPAADAADDDSSTYKKIGIVALLFPWVPVGLWLASRVVGKAARRQR
jgi:hypothetical protein